MAAGFSHGDLFSRRRRPTLVSSPLEGAHHFAHVHRRALPAEDRNACVAAQIQEFHPCEAPVGTAHPPGRIRRVQAPERGVDGPRAGGVPHECRARRWRLVEHENQVGRRGVPHVMLMRKVVCPVCMFSSAPSTARSLRFVQAGRRFVQDEDGGAANGGARDGNALALAVRQRHSALAHQGFVPCGSATMNSWA
jgi:hypothetical protein